MKKNTTGLSVLSKHSRINFDKLELESEQILTELLNIIITCLLPRLLKERAGIWKSFFKKTEWVSLITFMKENPSGIQESLSVKKDASYHICKMAKFLTQTPCMYVPLFWNLFCEDEPACRPQILKQRNSVKSFARLGNILLFKMCATCVQGESK